jgi:Fe2+ or Zn2+ uptake regulation protein
MGYEMQIVRIEAGCCPFCAEPINPDEFRDAVSRHEFELSGVCQKCQDKTFGV